jgi:transposase
MWCRGASDAGPRSGWHRGRSPRGERLVASVPHGHWKTLTLIAALRINGLTAPYVIDGAMDGPSFLAYVEQILAPTLRKGDIVFMDNLRTHKIDGVRHAVEAIGAKVRYLPAYSPDLNPIEMAFSKLSLAMKVQVMSDLHLGHWRGDVPS